MRVSWKAAVLPATIILLIFCSFIMPFVLSPQAAPRSVSLALQQGPFILKASSIDGTNARLQLLPDPLFPIFSFSSTTIQGLQIISPVTSDHTLTITASGQASASNVAIKTAIGYEIATALQSISNPADLLLLAAGATVPHLTMTNVTLVVDHYLQSATLSASGLQLALNSSAMALPAKSNISPAQIVASLTPTVCPTIGASTTLGTSILPTKLPISTTPLVCPTPTISPTVSVTPTLTVGTTPSVTSTVTGTTPTSSPGITVTPSVSASPSPDTATVTSGSTTPSSGTTTTPSGSASPSPSPSDSGSSSGQKSLTCKLLKIGC